MPKNLEELIRNGTIEERLTGDQVSGTLRFMGTRAVLDTMSTDYLLIQNGLEHLAKALERAGFRDMESVCVRGRIISSPGLDMIEIAPFGITHGSCA